MKKLILTVTALCLVLSLAACGSSKAEMAPAAPTGQTTEETQETAVFTGTLEDKKDFMITVTGEEGSSYAFNLEGTTVPAEVGQKVTVTYTGDIADFDSQLVAVKVELAQ